MRSRISLSSHCSTGGSPGRDGQTIDRWLELLEPFAEFLDWAVPEQGEGNQVSAAAWTYISRRHGGACLRLDARQQAACTPQLEPGLGMVVACVHVRSGVARAAACVSDPRRLPQARRLSSLIGQVLHG